MSKCTRCGKERVFKSSYIEKLNNSSVTYTVTVCPDIECQKLVEKGLVVEAAKRKIIHDEQEERTRELILRKIRLKSERAMISKSSV